VLLYRSSPAFTGSMRRLVALRIALRNALILHRKRDLDRTAPLPANILGCINQFMDGVDLEVIEDFRPAEPAHVIQKNSSYLQAHRNRVEEGMVPTSVAEYLPWPARARWIGVDKCMDRRIASRPEQSRLRTSTFPLFRRIGTTFTIGTGPEDVSHVCASPCANAILCKTAFLRVPSVKQCRQRWFVLETSRTAWGKNAIQPACPILDSISSSSTCSRRSITYARWSFVASGVVIA
jgi:hypothetical protein